jgi:hypothetical protein
MKKNFRCIISIMLLTFLGYQSAFAQCAAPTGGSVSIGNITCAGSGTVTVNSVTQGSSQIALTDCRFSVYDAGNTTIVKPNQQSPVISGLLQGTYTLHIQQVCSLGVSSDYTQTIQITGAYENPVLGVATTTTATCNDGSITVSATKGYGVYSYCLVNAQNDPAIPSSYVRAPQASGNFTGLTGGTYYVRVYDQCNSFVTMPVTVVSIPSTTPFSVYYNIDLNGCANYTIAQTLNWYIARDTNNKIWVTYPGNIVDTLPNAAASNNVYADVPVSSLTTYPAVVTLSYKNACGNIFSKSYTFNSPGYFVTNQRAGAYACGMGSYAINTPYLRDSFNTLNNVYNVWDAYSLDGGTTWISYAIPMSDTILVPVGSSRQVIYRRCGQQFPITVNGPDVQTLNMNVYQTGNINCGNNASIRIDAASYNGNVNKIWVQVTSVPDGQAPIPPFFFVHDYATTSGYPPQLMNLVPGTYSFLFTDECGGTSTRSITITPSHETLVVTPKFTCGSNNVGINIAYTKDQGGSYNLNYEIRNYNNNVVVDSRAYGGANVSINNLTPGIFTVKIWKTAYNTDTVNTLACPYIFTVDASLPGPLSLNQSAFALCTNDLATGSLIALPTGGLPPYSYSLYKGSVIVANQVGSAQTSNIFSNLDANATYIISVTDQCGAGSTYSNMFGNVQPVMHTSQPQQPCIGDFISLSVNSNPGLTYQWSKNGTAIANATDTLYKISSMTLADSGIYIVDIRANNCLLLSTAVPLDPTTCVIPIPLALDLISFSGNINAQNNAVLQWKIAKPEAGALFTILYSTDGIKFQQAGVVSEDGSNTAFSFIHRNYSIQQKTFYKLLMTDGEGTMKYSNTLLLQPGKNGQAKGIRSVSPVPFTNHVTINYSTPVNASATLLLSDVQGRVLKTQTVDLMSGVNNIVMQGLEMLPQGIYLLTLQNSNIRETVKIVK